MIVYSLVLFLSLTAGAFFAVTSFYSICQCSAPTSQTEGTQAAVSQLDVCGRGQLLSQLHHHTQGWLAAKKDHLQVPAAEHKVMMRAPICQQFLWHVMVHHYSLNDTTLAEKGNLSAYLYSKPWKKTKKKKNTQARSPKTWPTWRRPSRNRCCSESWPFSAGRCLEGDASTSAETQNTITASFNDTLLKTKCPLRALKAPALVSVIYITGMIISRGIWLTDVWIWRFWSL